MKMNPQKVESTTVDNFKRPSQTKEIWRRFSKSKGAVIGFVLFSIIAIMLLAADFIVPYEAAIKQDFTQQLAAPSREHFFGTDGYGRDAFARLLHGGRTSLSIALLATFSSAVLGSALGAISGYFGGKVDSFIMRSLDIFMSVPDILFTMAVVYALGANFTNLLFALTLAYFTNYVRLVRSQVLNLAEQDYVEAARAGGSGSTRIILSHIIPNAVGVIIVNTTLNVAKIILYESTLSFLGLGMPPPQPEWGLMLSEAREFMRTAPWLMFFPSAAIVITAASINLMGDGLRDALDPHLKS
ncbi:ABC transporter permease [Acidaminobacter sp.]|uniref:ABC transporter permease n=1 Tax=Acidaminobacter sp. TaxID=1872102 RepID=UPI002566D5E7|nr:ABC transporter permease [Acidaminobacter sp.]MDK9710511.1 ABC transporter permease [Acidaminobacter sp.]